jgi:hypothetical protein
MKIVCVTMSTVSINMGLGSNDYINYTKTERTRVEKTAGAGSKKIS